MRPLSAGRSRGGYERDTSTSRSAPSLRASHTHHLQGVSMGLLIHRGGTAAGGLLAIGTLVAAVAIPPTAHAAPTAAPAAAAADAGTCHLGNGVKHVINITFDNVHFFRDNPNVPSDLELMPTLYSF